MTSHPSFRIYGFDRNATAKQRSRGDGILDRNPSIGISFQKEEIQPTATRNNNIQQPIFDDVDRRRSTGGHGQTNLSTVGGPKKRCFPHLVSGFVQQQTVQPPRATTNFEDNKYDTIFDASEVKKRPRSSYSRTNNTTTSREPKIEIRIEGDTINDIIDEIRTKTIGKATQESSSILLKGIHGLSTSSIDSRREDETDKSLLLLNSLQDLVRNKGSSWKRIRIQECSPCITEVLLASPYATNFEEIHFVGICDDDKSISTQAESPSESDLQPIVTTIDARTRTSSLIISLLRKTKRIKELVLKDCDLDNLDLVRIMDMLCAHPNHPESLEYLDLRFNKFTPMALQSILANNLRSSLHSLKTVKLRQGLRCVVHRNIRDAILQSLRCNQVVLESIDVFNWDKSVQYLLDVNRAKRRSIFCNNDRFPRTLWPYLIEQALVTNGEDDCDLLVTERKSSSEPPPFVPRPRNISTARRQASVVYHIFRNGGPMLLEQHQFESN